MTKKGILFVISGPSGVGKGTIKNALMKRDTRVIESISVTTRAPRKDESEAQHYYFVGEEAFQEMVKQGELLEWARVYSHCYGTPRDFVFSNLEQGRDVLLEIDIQGALQVKQRMPDGVFIFISPPSIAELAERLAARGKDSVDSIHERLAACQGEMDHIRHYDYEVVNDDLEQAVEKVCSIIVAERCRIKKKSLGCDS